MQAVAQKKRPGGREEAARYPIGRRIFGGDWSRCDNPEIVEDCCGLGKQL